MLPKIAFLVDNPQRDLPAAVLLSSTLVSRGCRVFLVPFNLRRQEIAALAPDIVIVNNLYRTLESFVEELCDKGHMVAVLDNEGGIWNDFEEYKQALSANARIRDKIDLFFGWGPTLSGHLREIGYFRPEQIRVTGHPRMDFYARKWWPAVMGRTPYSELAGSDYVLVATKHPVSNPRFQTMEREIQTLIVNGYSEATARKYAAEDVANFNHTIEYLGALCRRLPNVKFILRPHPFERAETYFERLNLPDNLELRTEGTADGWILGAKAVVQRSSTTAVEAALVGIPSISPEWIPPLSETEWPSRVSHLCPTLDSLVEHVNAAVEGRLAPLARLDRLVDEVKQSWIGAVDGDAHLRIADAILEHWHSRPPKPTPAPAEPVTHPSGRGPSAGERIAWFARRPHRLPAALFRKLTGRFHTSAPTPAAPPSPCPAETRFPGNPLQWDQGQKAFHRDDVVTLASVVGDCARQSGRDWPAMAIRFAESDDYTAKNKSPRAVVFHLTPRQEA